jgi:MFS family permease
MQAFQQLCGFNTLIYYSATLFKEIGFDRPTAVGLIISGTNFIFTLVALKWIDKIGRRNIMIWSAPGMVVGLTLASIAFHCESCLFILLCFSDAWVRSDQKDRRCLGGWDEVSAIVVGHRVAVTDILCSIVRYWIGERSLATGRTLWIRRLVETQAYVSILSTHTPAFSPGNRYLSRNGDKLGV